MTRIVVVAMALALLGAPTAARAAEVDAGALHAATGGPDWSLRFTDRAGAPVLSERARAPSGPSGRLGFRTATGWWHATRVLDERRDGGAAVLTVATDDPLGRRLAVRVAPDADGVVALTASVQGPVTGDVEAVGIAFDARPDERFTGFGERSNAVDQRGTTLENYVAEGPYPLEDRPFIAAIVPPWGYHPRDDATTYPVPWLLSSSGYGVLVDSPQQSFFRLGSDQPDAWSVEVDANELALRVFAGPTPARALERFTARTGRQPFPRAPWFLGVWVMPNDFDREDVPAEVANVKRLRDADVPVSVAETTMQYLPCGDAQKLRDASAARVRAFHAAGLAILAYLHSQICVDYDPPYGTFRDRGLFVRDATGRPYVYKMFADRHAQVVVSLVDFTAPGAASAFADLVGEVVRDGYDGWMEDYGEYAPTDGRFANGETGATMHNRYPTSYHCGVSRFTAAQRRPVAAFVRSGWTGTARCAGLVWSGDPSATWGFDGLQSAIENGVNMGLSGVAFWASELGGLFELGTTKLSPELLKRWIEFGAVSPWMKARKKSIAIPDKPGRPQVWDPEILPVFRRYAKLHTQLLPYLEAAAATYVRTGMPIIRHLQLAYPGDPAARQDDAYLFGPDLLAAPVFTEGATERRLRLPPGRWVDLNRSTAYAARGDGGLRMRRAALLAGARDVTLPAPIDRLPLLARAGAVLPLLPADVDTLTDYSGGRGVVPLRARAGRLGLMAFPRGRTTARFWRDGRVASTERRRRWTLTVRGTRKRRYDIQASLATLRHPFRACRVLRDGRPLSRSAWRYDGARRALHVSVRGRRVVLDVRGCA